MRHRTSRVFAALIVMSSVALLLVGAGPAGAAPRCGWKRLAAPEPGWSHRLFDVDAAAGEVWAVGSFSYGSTVDEPVQPTRTLAIRRTASGWEHVPTPNGSLSAGLDIGWAENELVAVDVRTRKDVWAVGTYSDPTDDTAGPLALHFDGLTWRAVEVPHRPSGTTRLTDVAVTGETTWIGGSYTSDAAGARPEPLVLRFDGDRWTRERGLPRSGSVEAIAAGPRGAWLAGAALTAEDEPRALLRHSEEQASGPLANETADVTIAAPDEALAATIDREDPAAPESVALVSWNGKRWTKVAAPGVSADDVTVAEIAALPQGEVWVVGTRSRDSSAESTRFALRRHDRRWQVQRTPAVDDARDVVWSGVAAGEGARLWAVGSLQLAGDEHVSPLLETYRVC